MNTVFYIKLYLAAFGAFLVIDLLWLGLVARNFYQKHLGFIMAPNVNWAAAIIFYLLFILGLLIFAVVPGLQADSLGRALLLGALFGFFTYATYDLTNLATLKDRPLIVTVVDLIWGTVLATSVTLASYVAGQWFLG